MQGFDPRVPAADDHECEPATARRRGRWCAHPCLWSGCVGERVSSAFSEPRPVRALACNASRQSRECATPRYRWARYRGGRWVVCAYSHRARPRAGGALDAGDGCRTASQCGCGPFDGTHNCGDGRDGSSPPSCVRDDAPCRTRNPVDTYRWCDHHGRRLPTCLHTAIRQSARFHWMRPTPPDDTERFDSLELRHRWHIANSHREWCPMSGMFVVGPLIAATRRNTPPIDSDWAHAGLQSTGGGFMISSLEAPCHRYRANLSAISAIRNRHHIDLNRGPWTTTNPTNGT
jgi:hypothetical protein